MEPLIMDSNGWLTAVQRIAETEKKRELRVLLVDDDPIFCQSAAQLAKKRGVSLTACRSMGELFRAAKYHFDVAVLDYSFGDFTALQVAPMLQRNTPLMLISGMSRSEVHYLDWPLSIESFVSKASGLELILRRAIRIAKSSAVEGKPRTDGRGWLLLLASMALIGLGLLVLHRASPAGWNQFQWDAIESSHRVAVGNSEVGHEIHARRA